MTAAYKDDNDIKALPEPEENNDTIKQRQAKQKQELIEQLKKNPIVQIAVERAGIGRATYYRWRKEDQEFAKAADEAIETGSSLVSDLAEGQLINAIRDRELSAIFFWLRARHAHYKNKIEMTTNVNQELTELTAEQKAVIEQALKLGSLAAPDSGKDQKDVTDNGANKSD